MAQQIKKTTNHMDDLFDIGGWTTALTAIVLNILDHMPKLADINDVIVTATSIAGLLFLFSKWRGQQLDNKLKSKELEEDD